MISLRLKTIASLVDKNAKVIDIGTDHAYIPIYLVENNIAKQVLATDISPLVLEYAKKNIADHNLSQVIKLKVSDGFKNINEKYDLAIITGMGTKTIVDILAKAKEIPNTLIIQTNKNPHELRRYMQKIGYKIRKEEVVLDKHYYVIIKYIKGKDTLTEEEILFGKSNNLNYFTYLKDKYQLLYQKSQNEVYLNYLNLLNNLIEKKLVKKN